MIRGVHTMFYSSEPEAFRAFIRDKLGFPATDVGEGWLIFDLPRSRHGLSSCRTDQRRTLPARPPSRFTATISSIP